MKINEYVGDRNGSSLRAEIYSDVDGYNIKYFISEIILFKKKESY